MYVHYSETVRVLLSRTNDVFKDCPERDMLKCYYASTLPTIKRKTTLATLLTSLSCRLFHSASSQLRGSANKSNACHSDTFPSLLLSCGRNGSLKEVWRSDRAVFPFHQPQNRSIHRTRTALLWREDCTPTACKELDTRALA